MAFEIPVTLKEVEKRTGWSRFKIFRLRNESGFPIPLPGGGYLWSEIETWQQKLIEERDAKKAEINAGINVETREKINMYVETKHQLYALGKQLKSEGINVKALA